MNHRISIHNQAGIALTPQKKIDLFNFPFTLNMNIGCLYACNYCYLQGYPFSRHAEFGRETKVKLWLPEKLDQELAKYQDLPQHLKRVQINPATEGLHPKVLRYMRENCNRDLVREMLEVFQRHWQAGNHWMVHFVTKSNSITNYVDLLSQMKHMVQVEITIITSDPIASRKLEPYAPSVNARLRAVETLSKAGIFVRIMAMPFITFSSTEEQTHQDMTILKELCFSHGAIAFKNKGLNYFNAEDVRSGQARKIKSQENRYFEDLIIKSGEVVFSKNKKPRSKIVLMPREECRKNWAVGPSGDKLERRKELVTDYGYSTNNSIKWGNVL